VTGSAAWTSSSGPAPFHASMRAGGGRGRATSALPGERYAILDVWAQNLPAGHRLIPLLLGQIGQMPRTGAGHLSSVTPRPSLMPRYRRIRHPAGLPSVP
jgi:hypothetical protein